MKVANTSTQGTYSTKMELGRRRSKYVCTVGSLMIVNSLGPEEEVDAWRGPRMSLVLDSEFRFGLGFAFSALEEMRLQRLKQPSKVRPRDCSACRLLVLRMPHFPGLVVAWYV